MLKALSRFVFLVTGWKIIGEMPKDLKKGVIIAAPHTSYWDFLYARAAFFIMDIPMKVTIKKEVVNFPVFGWFARKLGAIGIDRNPKNGSLKRKKSMVDAMVDLINEREELIMMITPEGTRKYAPRWKTGFYRVAEGAKVPIILGYLDYAKKHAGLGPVVHPSGNYDEDLEKIMRFYRDKTAKYPNQGVL